jgi:hypothetical protein
MMEQPTTPTAGRHLPWWTRSRGRIVTALVAATLACLLSWRPPEDLNLLLTYDCGVIAYIMIFCIMIFCILVVRASPADAAEISRRGEPNGALTMFRRHRAVGRQPRRGGMLNNPGHRPRWEHSLHMTLSLLLVPDPHLFRALLHAPLF